MKRTWTNWLFNSKSRRPGMRPLRKFGSGFEVIEPRLLMASDAGASPHASDSGDTIGNFIDIGDRSAEEGEFSSSDIERAAPSLADESVEVLIESGETPYGAGTVPTDDEPLLDEIGTTLSPDDGPAEGELFTPPGPSARIPAPPPESSDISGGAIDISPRDGLQREEDLQFQDVDARSLPRTRVIASNQGNSVSRATASMPLRAARGEAQAFELANMNWRADPLANQRVAPPKPDDLLAAPQVAGNEVLFAEQVPSAPVDIPAPTRDDSAQLAAAIDEALETAINNLAATLVSIAGIQTTEANDQSSAAPIGAPSNAARLEVTGSAYGQFVTTALADYAEQHVRLADHDTAARMVGFGIMVAACQASAAHIPADAPKTHRNCGRNWEIKSDPQNQK